jgi:2-polyprenyl-3-methyl-5-hydroxy-6-metoxy-1,4-benzoquinol methylase
VPAALDHRDRTPELMDDPGLDPAEHRAALTGLAWLNRLSLSAGVLWPAIRALACEHPGERVRVLDVATGGGDVPIRLWMKAKRAGLGNLVFHGCDVSPTALRIAEENAARAGAAVGFFTHDVIRDPLPGGYDIVTCSLFLHHLSDEGAVTVLRRMKEAAGRLVLVNDLARSRFNYLAVWLACRVLTRSRVVRFDGPVSVRSAFTPAEAHALAERAGLTEATAARRFPCRYLLSWSRP